MDIAELQLRIRDLLRGIEHPRSGAALALAEECGEVMRCVLEREYYGAAKDGDLEDEVGDVLIALTELCDRYDIALASAADRALGKLEEKAPGWRASLGDRLQHLRQRMDG